MAYNNYSKKADFRKERVNTYIPYYGTTGLCKVPQKLGFKPNVQVIKKSNYDQFLNELSLADFVSLDTETTSLRFDEAKVISINVGLPNNNNYVGFYYLGFFDESKRDNLVSESQLDEAVKAVLSKPAVFMWNRYYDQQVLTHARGFKEEQFWTCHDGMMLLWLMDSNVHAGLGLKESAQNFLGIQNYAMEDAVWEDITKADPRKLILYGGMDSYCTLELGTLLYRIFKKHYPFMLQLALEFKNALHPFGEQHQLIDAPYVENLSTEVAKLLEEVKARFFEAYGTINLNSPQQKSALLLKLGYSTGVWNNPTKYGVKVMSTAEKLLQGLADKGCEPAKLMIRCSKLSKLQNSYLTPMVQAGKSGKPIRFYFRDRTVATLRLSAGKYNINRKVYNYYLPISMQCLPKAHKVNRELDYDPGTFEIEWPSGRGQYYVETGSPEMNVRKAFHAGPGGMIIRADFKQEELAVPAVLANETTWLDALKAGKDLHKATGRMVYGRDITGDERKTVKGINFGILYEIDNPEYVISNQTGWPIERSREFLQKYKAALPRLYAWKEKAIQEGRATGSIKNLFGFERRVYSYYHTANRQMHKYGDRTCVNQEIQGLCAIFMRILMVKFWKMLYLPQGKYYGSGISFMLSLHDEMVFRAADKSILPEFLPDFRDTMSSVTPEGWPIKLEAEVEIGLNYGETFPVSQNEAGLWIPKEEERKEGQTQTIQEASKMEVVESALDDWAEGVEEEFAEMEGFKF